MKKNIFPIRCWAIFKEGRLYNFEFCKEKPLSDSLNSYDKEAIEVYIIPVKSMMTFLDHLKGGKEK